MTVIIGDYLQLLNDKTREIAQKKLKQFLLVIKQVISKFLNKYSPEKKVTFLLKGLILFKREDLATSKVLDYEVDSNDGEVVFTFEKFV